MFYQSIVYSYDHFRGDATFACKIIFVLTIVTICSVCHMNVSQFLYSISLQFSLKTCQYNKKNVYESILEALKTMCHHVKHIFKNVWLFFFLHFPCSYFFKNPEILQFSLWPLSVIIG